MIIQARSADFVTNYNKQYICHKLEDLKKRLSIRDFIKCRVFLNRGLWTPVEQGLCSKAPILKGTTKITIRYK